MKRKVCFQLRRASLVFSFILFFELKFLTVPTVKPSGPLVCQPVLKQAPVSIIFLLQDLGQNKVDCKITFLKRVVDKIFAKLCLF